MRQMNFLSLVQAKREGKEHTKAEIEFIIDSVMSGGVDDRAVAAWLMAVCCRGMSVDETAVLTATMAQSGKCWISRMRNNRLSTSTAPVAWVIRLRSC